MIYSTEAIDVPQSELSSACPTAAASLDALNIEEGFVFKIIFFQVSQKTPSFRKPGLPSVIKIPIRLPWINRNKSQSVRSHEQKYENIRKGFLLSVAYSATIGGLSSLVGTAPNIFVKGFADRLTKKRYSISLH